MAGPPDSRRRDKDDPTEEPESVARRLVARVVIQVRTFPISAIPQLIDNLYRVRRI